MQNEVNKLTSKIFGNSRLDMDFFMYLPTGTAGANGDTITVNCNPVLYLRYKPPKNISQEYNFSKAAYKVTPKNLYHVIKFFNTIMKWFFDDQYSDLYLLNENNELVFNADYNKLSISTHRGDYDTCIMQAIPTVVKLGDKSYEGINLYINTSTYCAPLTFQEVSIIFGILKDFSFSEEVTKLITCYNYIKTYNSYSSGRDYGGKTPFDL